MLSKTENSSEEQLRKELADVHDLRMKELEKQNVSNWVEMAEIAVMVRDNNEAPLLGYESWADWLQFAAPQSASAVHESIRILEQIGDDVPREDVRQMPKGNAKVVTFLPQSDRQDPEWIKKAQTLKPKKLVAEVQRKRPGLHIEDLVPRKLGFSYTQSLVIDGAVSLYQVLEGKPQATAEEALEGACAAYILQNLEEYEKISGKKLKVARKGKMVSVEAHL